MKLTQDLFRHLAQEVYGKTKFTSRGHTFDLADEWERIDYVKIIDETFRVNIFTSPEKEMQEILSEKGVELTGIVNRSRLIDNLWKLIRKTVAGQHFSLMSLHFSHLSLNLALMIRDLQNVIMYLSEEASWRTDIARLMILPNN